MCVLRVHGEPFDAQAFLAASTFHPCVVWERGTPRRALKNQIHEDSGFNVDVSHAASSDLPRQCKDAQAFLRRHDADLRRLKEQPGVTAELDFRTEAAPWDRLLILWEGAFPSRLLWHAGSLGVSLRVTLYIAPRPKPDAEPPAEADSSGTVPEQTPPVF